jgi:hypothetical protein
LGSKLVTLSVPDSVEFYSNYELPSAGNLTLSLPASATAAICRRGRILGPAGEQVSPQPTI